MSTEQKTLSPEIEDRFEELKQEIERMNGNVNGAFGKISGLADQLEQLNQRLDDIERRVAAAETDAEMAVSISAHGPAQTDGGPTKAGRARRLSRDEVIRATADGIGAGPRDLKSGRSKDRIGSVTVSDVQDMGKPQMELKWKTVAKDAWPVLVEEWPCFRIEDPEDGAKRLTVVPDEIPIELARVVERSLERDDIANRVVGGRESGGA